MRIQNALNKNFSYSPGEEFLVIGKYGYAPAKATSLNIYNYNTQLSPHNINTYKYHMTTINTAFGSKYIVLLFGNSLDIIYYNMVYIITYSGNF